MDSLSDTGCTNCIFTVSSPRKPQPRLQFSTYILTVNKLNLRNEILGDFYTTFTTESLMKTHKVSAALNQIIKFINKTDTLNKRS